MTWSSPKFCREKIQPKSCFFGGWISAWLIWCRHASCTDAKRVTNSHQRVKPATMNPKTRQTGWWERWKSLDMFLYLPLC